MWASARRRMQLLFDPAQNQFLHAPPFIGSPALQLAIERVRNIDSSSHIPMLPYLWQIPKFRSPGVSLGVGRASSPAGLVA